MMWWWTGVALAGTPVVFDGGDAAEVVAGFYAEAVEATMDIVRA